MANQHSTLTSLFTDIANAIRKVEGSTRKYVADEFPSWIIDLGKPVATQWDAKFDKVLTPTLSNTSCAVTLKAISYYDGYWYAVGNDSAGDLYKLYGATTSSLSAYKIGSSRNYPATGVVCDGTYVWICCATGSYSNRILLRQTVSEFRSSNTSLGTYTSTTANYADMCRINSTYTFLFGGYASSSGGMIGKITNGTTTAALNSGFASSVPEALVSGCAYNETAVAVTNGGYIVWWQDPSKTTFRFKQRPYMAGAQKVQQMGNYLCVGATKSDGTYLYFTDVDLINNDFAGFKLTDEQLTIIGMAYVGGV